MDTAFGAKIRRKESDWKKEMQTRIEKWILSRLGVCGLDLSGSGQGPFAVSCEFEEFLDNMRNCQLVKKNFSLRCQLTDSLINITVGLFVSPCLYSMKFCKVKTFLRFVYYPRVVALDQQSSNFLIRTGSPVANSSTQRCCVRKNRLTFASDDAFSDRKKRCVFSSIQAAPGFCNLERMCLPSFSLSRFCCMHRVYFQSCDGRVTEVWYFLYWDWPS